MMEIWNIYLDAVKGLFELSGSVWLAVFTLTIGNIVVFFVALSLLVAPIVIPLKLLLIVVVAIAEKASNGRQ